MKTFASFAVLLEGFFTQRLMKQRCASPHTIRSYRDTFHLLLKFIQQRLRKPPSQLELTEVDAPLICAFLDEMEGTRHISCRSRNVRLSAIRSFFHYAALEAPAQSAQIQRVLAIPSKKHTRNLVNFLTLPEVEALLAAPDQQTWSGRRDHALLLVAVQAGLRLSELTGLQRKDLVLMSTGAHVRVIGKGRKERCTPLTKQTAAVLKAWLLEPVKADAQPVFPNARGGRLSRDGVQYILSRHAERASGASPTLKEKRISPHCLRHTCAMELLQAGIDRAMIALWLGHESVETTQIYLHADLALKEKLLSTTAMPEGKPSCYRPGDELLAFLRSL
jgi:site-specific recombinase XerD